MARETQILTGESKPVQIAEFNPEEALACLKGWTVEPLMHRPIVEQESGRFTRVGEAPTKRYDFAKEEEQQGWVFGTTTTDGTNLSLAINTKQNFIGLTERKDQADPALYAINLFAKTVEFVPEDMKIIFKGEMEYIIVSSGNCSYHDLRTKGSFSERVYAIRQ